MNPMVRREKNPRWSLFGPQCWWTVYLTPWQPVASFAHHQDALLFGALITISRRNHDRAQ